MRYRSFLGDVRRVVVKIGSRVLVQKTGRPDVRRMRELVHEIARLHHTGLEMVVVTSGAIGAGMQALRMTQRPKELPDLQMAAAVGQTRLMSRYDALFAGQDCRVGQILLTHADFHHKIRQTNARRTINNLLRHRVIPIINENDVVADEEIRADLAVGDNDSLASMVVKMIRADLLIMLTTTDGLREPGHGGRTRRIHYLERVDRKALALVTQSDSIHSKGGMLTKLKAAQAAAEVGCAAIIANGRQTGVLARIMRGDDAGTLILAE